MAQILADYVAHQNPPHPPLEYGEIEALIDALRDPEIGTDHEMAVRLTAIHQGTAPGSIPRIAWISEIAQPPDRPQSPDRPQFAGAAPLECPPKPRGTVDPTDPTNDAKFHFFGDCPDCPDTLAVANMPVGISLDSRTDIIVVQLCARLTNPGIAQNLIFDEIIYRMQVYPFNNPATRPPPPPAVDST